MMVEVRHDDPDEHLAADLEELLAEDERVAEQGIVVLVHGDVVRVTGAVATDARRDAIATVVSEQVPRRRIELDVSVLADEMRPPSGEEHVS